MITELFSQTFAFIDISLLLLCLALNFVVPIGHFWTECSLTLIPSFQEEIFQFSQISGEYLFFLWKLSKMSLMINSIGLSSIS